MAATISKRKRKMFRPSKTYQKEYYEDGEGEKERENKKKNYKQVQNGNNNKFRINSALRSE